MEDKQLSVKIISPDRIMWEGNAEAVSSENSDGPFDILPEHANFITLIKSKPIVIHRSDGDTNYSFSRAVVHAINDTVSIYVQLGADKKQAGRPASKKGKGANL